jgi:hypothetical protein
MTFAGLRPGRQSGEGEGQYERGAGDEPACAGHALDDGGVGAAGAVGLLPDALRMNAS